MIDCKQNETLFVEKYRPQKIADCILPENIKKPFTDIVAKGKLPNCILSGTAGCGKTTLAKALCVEMGYDYLMINASEENGIDILRTKIRQYASAMSLHSSMKVIILDEADSLTSATQTALRGFMEEFSKGCRFILTCNFKNKIIDPLHSRCSVIDFHTGKTELPNLCQQFMSRLIVILDNEKITYEKKVLAELIMMYAPDWRRVLNEIQRFSASGTLSPAVLSSLSEQGIDDLIKILKKKDFTSMRKWVGANPDIDSSAIFRLIYDRMIHFGVEPKSMPQIVILINDYQDKATRVADKEINTAAFLTEVMGFAEWK